MSFRVSLSIDTSGGGVGVGTSCSPKAKGYSESKVDSESKGKGLSLQIPVAATGMSQHVLAPPPPVVVAGSDSVVYPMPPVLPPMLVSTGGALSVGVPVETFVLEDEYAHIPVVKSLPFEVTDGVQDVFVMSKGKLSVLNEKIGSGNSSSVFKGKWQPHGSDTVQDCVVKCVAVHKLKEHDGLHEASIHESLGDSPHIVGLYDYGQHDDIEYLVFEPCEASLDSVSHDRYHLSHEARVQLLTDLIAALEVVYEKGYVYSDLKPGNVMLKEGSHKLGDFGNTKPEGTDEITGTLHYLPSLEPQSQLTDIYMLGVTFGEVALGISLSKESRDIKSSIQMKNRYAQEALALQKVLTPLSSYEELAKVMDATPVVETDDTAAYNNSLRTIMNGQDTVSFELQKACLDLVVRLLADSDKRPNLELVKKDTFITT